MNYCFVDVKKQEIAFSRLASGSIDWYEDAHLMPSSELIVMFSHHASVSGVPIDDLCLLSAGSIFGVVSGRLIVWGQHADYPAVKAIRDRIFAHSDWNQ